MALLGFWLGGLIGHWLTKVRDAGSRRRAFIGFVHKWRAGIKTPKPRTTGYPVDPVGDYMEHVGEFHGLVATARDTFKDIPNFDDLTARAGNLGEADWKGKDPRATILEALDELIAALG